LPGTVHEDSMRLRRRGSNVAREGGTRSAIAAGANGLEGDGIEGDRDVRRCLPGRGVETGLDCGREIGPGDAELQLPGRGPRIAPPGGEGGAGAAEPEVGVGA
jgi:hypothetical protein